MRINNMITSLVGINAQSRAIANIDHHNEKIKTGIRIKSSSEDSVGITLSKRLKSHITSLNSAKRNITEGITLLQSADAAMNDIGNMLNKAYSMSLKVHNGVSKGYDKDAIVLEAKEMKESITNMIDTKSYNNLYYLQGDFATIQTGIHDGDKTEINTANLSHLVRHLIIKEGGKENIAKPDRIKDMIHRLSEERAIVNSHKGNLEYSLSNIITAHGNMLSAESKVTDTNIALELSKRVKQDIIGHTASTILGKTMTTSYLLNLLDS